MAAVVSRAALADDAVAIRHARARGVSEVALRRQLAAVPTPRLRHFVFVRRVTIRAGPDQLGRAMEAALARLAEDGRSEVLSFADLSALTVACARAALSGGLGGWHWRTLGLARLAGPGEAVAALLTAHPREAGSAVAALAAHGLLGKIWQDMPMAAAARLTAALVQEAGFPMPAWPADESLPLALPPSATALLARASDLWAPVLGPLPPRAEPVRTAAVLSLLRWSPRLLRSPDSPIWPALLACITARAPATARAPPPARGALAPPADNHSDPVAPRMPLAARQPRQISPPPDQASDSAAPSPGDPGRSAEPHGEAFATGWGGVLFLLNALRRLDIEALLAAEGATAPTGWRLLHDLALALGLPEDEPMAIFLAGQDLDTVLPPALLATLLGGLESLYSTDGPWPLPLAQLARLRATETHLDLDLATTSVDLTLRLSGLDLDPGWVPWLGRVATFHYAAVPTHYRRSG